MTEPAPPRPTDAELQILNVLWERGPSTVRDVHAALGRRTGYTTVLKLLQIMADKGLVLRDESRRSHVYRPRHKQHRLQRQLVKDMLDRVFAGAADQLIVQALEARRISPRELADIRRLLDDYERSRS
jgi:predicted transcriptional regulator